MNTPQLLRIPETFRTVDAVLGVAEQLNLTNVLVLSERENGDLVFLDSNMTMAQANWLIDRFKTLLVLPSRHGMINVS